MGKFLKSAMAGIAGVLLSVGVSRAETPTHEAKYDKRVAAAAGELAAAKIGNIRGSIDHDQKPVIAGEVMERGPDSSRVLISPSALQVTKKPLPPLVQNILDDLDTVITGSINTDKLTSVSSQPRITWERFDSSGRLVKLR